MKTYQARIRLKAGGSAIVVYDADPEDARQVVTRRYKLADSDVIRIEEIGDAINYDDDEGPVLTRSEIAAIALVGFTGIALLLWYIKMLGGH